MPADPPVPFDRVAARRRLLAERRAMPDRDARAGRLAEALAAWLAARPEQVVGAYWPIRGEFDPLPVLAVWLEGAPDRTAALPVIDAVTDAMAFHAWWPGCPMTPDRYGIPMPLETSLVVPELLLVPCLGFGPHGVRLGYGGGYYDRTLGAMLPEQRPVTLGIAFAAAFLPELVAEPHDVPLARIMTEDGLVE